MAMGTIIFLGVKMPFTNRKRETDSDFDSA